MKRFRPNRINSLIRNPRTWFWIALGFLALMFYETFFNSDDYGWWFFALMGMYWCFAQTDRYRAERKVKRFEEMTAHEEGEVFILVRKSDIDQFVSTDPAEHHQGEQLLRSKFQWIRQAMKQTGEWDK